jgi:hypothetical protein
LVQHRDAVINSQCTSPLDDPKAQQIYNIKEETILSMRLMSAIVILPFLAASSLAQTAKPMDRTTSIRAECFRQANEAARAQAGMASANPAATAEANSVGANAYYSCIRSKGLRR